MIHLLVRDLYGNLRKGRTYLLFSLGVMIPALALIRGWPSDGVLMMDAQPGPDLFRGVALAQLFFIALVLPGLAGVAITAEREQGTLGMLLASAATPEAIMMSKCLSASLVVLGMVCLGFPVLSFTLFLGGVPPSWLVAHLVAVLAGAIGVSAVGVGVSSLWSRSAEAIPAAYLVCGLYCGQIFAVGFRSLPYLEPSGVISDGNSVGGTPRIALNAILFLWLLGWIRQLADGRTRRGGRWMVGGLGLLLCGIGSLGITSEWGQAALIAFLLGLGAVILTGRLLAVQPPKRSVSHGTEGGNKQGLRAPGGAEGAVGFSGNRNPVFAAERQTRLLGRRGMLVQIAYWAALGSQLFLLILTLRLEWLIDADRWVYVAVQLFVGMGWVVCGLLSATSLPSERERSTLPLLQGSLLSLREITMGKWLGSLWYGQILVIAAIPLLLNAALTETLPLEILVRLAMAMVGGVIMASSLGMWVALTSRRTAPAVGRWLMLTGILLAWEGASALDYLPRAWMVVPATPWGRVAAAFSELRPERGGFWADLSVPLAGWFPGWLGAYTGEVWLLAMAGWMAVMTWLLAPWVAGRWGGRAP